jgi:hypothetical protein
MKKLLFTILCVAGLMGFIPSKAMAQVPADVNNPTAAEMDCSTDHATIDGYELDILRPDGTVLQTLTFVGTSKPTPSATNKCRVSLNVQPIAFASGYSVRARSKAGTAYSDYAVSQNKFNRVPGRPGLPILLASLTPAPSLNF